MSSKIHGTLASGNIPRDTFKYHPLLHARRLYVQFVQGLFSAAPSGYYHWSPELESTEIVIQDESVINSSVVGKRPAITFTRGPIAFTSLGLDDMLSLDMSTGKKVKSVLLPGTMTINCVSRVPIESETLAGIVAESIWLNRELLMSQGFFEIGRQMTVGAPSPAGSVVAGDMGDGWTVCTVTSPFYMYRTSQVVPLGNQMLGGISVSLNVPAAVAEARQVADTTPNMPYGFYETVPSSLPSEPALSPGNAGAPAQLPRVAHPLNPTREVVVRVVQPMSARTLARRNGRTLLPIDSSGVVQSGSKATTVKFKV